jgi:ribose 5-phosphate isomerase B
MIAIGNDHAGLELKAEIIKLLQSKGLEFKDYGAFTTDSCDYPVYAKLVANAVASGEAKKGILICGTGIGMSITANKVSGVRCALCGDTFSAEATRLHNNSNVLALGARVTGIGLALKITETWLDTGFEDEGKPDGRHLRRINLIES